MAADDIQYPHGSNRANLAAAIAAVVAVVGATPASAEHAIGIYNGATITEAITIPLYSNCKTVREFPMVFRTYSGEATGTISGNITTSNVASSARFEDLTLTGGDFSATYPCYGIIFKNCDIVWSQGGDWTGFGELLWDGCTIDCVGVNLGNIANGSVFTLKFKDCAIRVDENDDFFYFLSGSYSSLQMDNCAIIGSGSASFITSYSTTYSTSLAITNCTFYNFEYIFNLGAASYGGSFFDLHGNIYDNCGTIVNTSRYFTPESISSSNNRMNNVTTIYETAGTDYDSIAEAQANGWEANSTTGAPSYVSTAWGNANFLKLSSSLASANNVGLNEDAFGTAREKYSDIDPGWHQHTAATEPVGTTPTFAGIASLSDGGDGTLIVGFAEGTGTTFYEVHVHTSSMSSGNLDARAYAAMTVDHDGSGNHTVKLPTTAKGATKLVAGTKYYVAVVAWNTAAVEARDNGSTNLTATPTNPNASGGPAIVIPDETPVQLGTSATEIYAVPAGKRGVLVSLILCNTDSAARTVTLYKVKDGDAAADDVAFLKDHVLEPAGTEGHTWVVNDTMTLTAGTKIEGLSDVADKVTVTISVVEATP